MKVTVDTAGRQGLMAKHVVIHSNDAVTPTVSVTLMLTVEQKPAPPPDGGK